LFDTGVSEDLIIETLGRVGQVLSFRLVYDKDTGKPKGFGFGEFADADQAAAAVRNLNDYELMGRKLRVDYSKDGEKDEHGGGASAPTPMASGMNGQDNNQSSSTLPPLPPGTDLGHHLTAQDAISATVATIPPMQLLDAMQQMQNLAKEDPDKATELLQQGPQLTYAILQIMVLMKLVDNATLATVLQQQALPPPVRQQPVAQPPPPQPTPQAYGQYPPPHQQYGAPTPPGTQPYQPPQQAPPPAQQPDRNALIQQVLSMPQEQIDGLPPNERAQMMALRQSLMQQYQR
jgi:cleavage stimulation factor subunit 2